MLIVEKRATSKLSLDEGSNLINTRKQEPIGIWLLILKGNQQQMNVLCQRNKCHVKFRQIPSSEPAVKLHASRYPIETICTTEVSRRFPSCSLGNGLVKPPSGNGALYFCQSTEGILLDIHMSFIVVVDTCSDVRIANHWHPQWGGACSCHSYYAQSLVFSNFLTYFEWPCSCIQIFV